MKIRLVQAELFHVDRQTDRQRQTDMTSLIVALRNFAIAPKNVKHSIYYKQMTRLNPRVLKMPFIETCYAP